jgi:hypothetical protein
MSILLEILPLSPPTKILDWNMERGIDLLASHYYLHLALTIPYQAVLDIKRSISLKVTKRLRAG